MQKELSIITCDEDKACVAEDVRALLQDFVYVESIPMDSISTWTSEMEGAIEEKHKVRAEVRLFCLFSLIVHRSLASSSS